jgi:epoxyqueuosine reductase
MTDRSMTLKREIRERAAALGFDLCGFTTGSPPESAPRLLDALRENRHAEMKWLARNADKRTDPGRVLPGIKSVITLAAAHAGPSGPAPRGSGVVAAYARHNDYHEVLAAPLRDLAAFIDAHTGGSARSLWYVDTGPILERDLAQRAGIGFAGKHTNLIAPRLGNWLLLSEILTTAAIEPDPPQVNRCGTCSRCITACPTGAITAPFILDARRCISYLTIELRGAIPEPLRPAIGNRIFGCDDCLAACPWNKFAREGRLLSAAARPDLRSLDLLEVLGMDAQNFKQRFSGTPMERTRRNGLRRNACVALGNTAGTEALPALRVAASDADPIVAEHAAWAVRRIEDGQAKR